MWEEQLAVYGFLKTPLKLRLKLLLPVIGGSRLVILGLTGYIHLEAKKYGKPRMSGFAPFGFQALAHLSFSGLAWATYMAVSELL